LLYLSEHLFEPTYGQEQNSLSTPAIYSDDLRAGRKKALLIGIASELSGGYPGLEDAHIAVMAMRDLLLDQYDCCILCSFYSYNCRYDYQPRNITVLVDDGIDDHPQPTRANIVRICFRSRLILMMFLASSDCYTRQGCEGK
jgi:hypothetical protein